jgi:phenylpropionate dioxygenase-like ring-hydroxylating dioxygenase large terminal subunit
MLPPPSDTTGKAVEESTLQRHYTPVPHEGDDGLFRQSWYALCRSSDLPPGGVLGRPFLDGRVAIYRGYDGTAQVVSAYCPHVGADLRLGRVVGNSLRCAFHGWEFGRDGRCQRTGIGDPPPPTARLYTFPTQERYGMVWAFNGEAPLFDLVDPSRPWSNLLLDVATPFEIDNDPWVVCSNTPDWAHFATVHRFDFPREGQNESLTFEEFGVRRHFDAQLEHGAGPGITFDVTVRGTNLVLVEGVSGGHWFAVAACMGLPRPRKCDFFVVTMIDRTEDATLEAAQARLRESTAIAARMGAEDSPIWNAMRFKPGLLTKADRALAQYLEQLRRFPRAHPSVDFIN